MFYTKFKIQNLRHKPGVATIITVLSISTLMLTLSLTSSILAYWANQNMSSNTKSLKAYYAAYSGIQDALIKLERNKQFSGNSTLSVNGTEDVSVSVSNNSSSATITSTATFNLVNKEFQTIVDIDSTTGLITPTSTTELPLQ